MITLVRPLIPTTTHNRLTDEEKQQSGIAPSLIRLSIGHEDVADLKNDLHGALAKALN